MKNFTVLKFKNKLIVRVLLNKTENSCEYFNTKEFSVKGKNNVLIDKMISFLNKMRLSNVISEEDFKKIKSKLME